MYRENLYLVKNGMCDAVTATEPPRPVKYHYHLAIDGKTEAYSLSVRILPCMDLCPCPHLFPIIFSLLYDLSTDYYHNPPFLLYKWMLMESALPTWSKCNWLVT